MLRRAAADEVTWRCFLETTSRAQPAVTAALQAATPGDPAGRSVEEQLIWDVRATALLGAISTAYRHWALTPDYQLNVLIAAAVDVVLPIVTPPHHEPCACDPLPPASIQNNI